MFIISSYNCSAALRQTFDCHLSVVVVAKETSYNCNGSLKQPSPPSRLCSVHACMCVCACLSVTCVGVCLRAAIHICSSMCVVWQWTSYQRWVNRVIFHFMFSQCFIARSLSHSVCLSSLARSFQPWLFILRHWVSEACQSVWQAFYPSINTLVCRSFLLFSCFLCLYISELCWEFISEIIIAINLMSPDKRFNRNTESQVSINLRYIF